MNINQKKLFQLDPRTKILLVLTISTILVSGGTQGNMFYVRIFLSLTPIVLLFIDGKVTLFVKLLFLYGLLFFIDVNLSNNIKGTLNFILGAMVGIFTHMLPGFIMAYYLFVTTKVSEFILAMEKLKTPKTLIIPLSVLLRMFPTMKEEYSYIQDAMIMRAISWKNGPAKMFEYRIIPFIVSTITIGDELIAASLTRGIDNPIKRTNYFDIKIKFLDVVIITACILCWAIYFFDKVKL